MASTHLEVAALRTQILSNAAILYDEGCQTITYFDSDRPKAFAATLCDSPRRMPDGTVKVGLLAQGFGSSRLSAMEELLDVIENETTRQLTETKLELE